MIRLRRSILSVIAPLMITSPLFAMPNFLEDFRKDPFRRSSVDGCAVCHVNPQGGGDRNPFGQAFERAGERITTLLRSQFPDRFAYPVSPGGGNVVIHFSDPDNRQIVVEGGGSRTVVDVAAKSVNGNPASGAAAPASSPGQSPAKRPDVPVDPYAREGAFFGMQVVNLPNGKPLKAGSVDFLVGHRFTETVSDAGLGGLFGFGSDGPRGAFVTYGAYVGLTNRISVGAVRSNIQKTIEVNSMVNVTRQSASVPFTLSVRGGVEGRNNFHERDAGRSRWVSPFIQPVAVHTIADRVSLELAPTFAFNTRDEDTFNQVFDGDHNNTIGLGMAAGVRLLPTTSLVGEYIPRVYGFHGESRFYAKDRPGLSIGLQKSTFRHTFELVVSRQRAMTTAQYAVQGTDTFAVGFNIFRKIR